MSAVKTKKLFSKRYLGLALSGAKNSKTALAILENYPKEHKIFLLETYDGLGGNENESSDEALCATIRENMEKMGKLGVNAPLSLPPCISCTKRCPLPSKCTVSSVKWMREVLKKKKKPNRELTPYTIRPLEVWIRFQILEKLPPLLRFDLDETLGGSRAPLSARIHFLQKNLKKVNFIEVLPKLSMAALALKLKIPFRWIHSYRSLDRGPEYRDRIIEMICDKCEIFIYERDARKLVRSLGAFDAFICAYTAYLSDLGFCEKPEKHYPKNGGWAEFPAL